MSRYIDADELQNAIYHEAFETDTEMQRWDSGCWIRYKLFENILDQQPTADVVEVVHGEWIDTNPSEPLDPRMTCSICGNTEMLFKGNFCPNCGARMERGERCLN